MMSATLCQYRVVEKVGAGGMGEVYRAEDTRLGREVALKVLPESFAADEERLLRFDREARLLASLNHPNIATLHGFERDGDTRFLVMELVEGETLAERIGRGAIPVDEALPLFLQIAEGLEAAHEKGIIHRDLKPGNIKVTGEGRIKILDFGLAKAFLGAGEASGEAETLLTDLSRSPTLTAAATRRGEILGTAAYMSPEQARGRPVDKRTDVWAFGCCLFEALSGERPFRGADATETLASVLKDEPDWDALPAALPWRIREVLERCLRKDLRERLHDIADVRIELAAVGSEEVAAPGATPGTSRNRLLVELVGGAMLVTATALLTCWTTSRTNAPEEWVMRTFELPAATNRMSQPDDYGGPVLSPDGKSIAYVADDRLWIRDLSSLDPLELAGTEFAERPFWSPGSDWVGYFRWTTTNAGLLYKVPVAGGPSTGLGLLPLGSAYGAAWWEHGSIVLSLTRSEGWLDGRLYAVDAEGGPILPLIEEPSGRAPGIAFPHLLPDGETLLVVEVDVDGTGTVVARRRSERHELVSHPGELLAFPVYTSPGYVVYQRGAPRSVGIWGFPFDLGTLERRGEPFAISKTGSHPSVGQDGTLLFHRVEGESLQQLVWVDRGGRVVETIGPPQEGIEALELSPDGRRVAFVAEAEGNWDIWIHDLVTGIRTRMTVHPEKDIDPRWSPDGTRIAFASGRSGAGDIFVQPAGGRGSIRPVVTGPEPQWFPEWEPDGLGLLFHSPSAEGEWGSWRVALDGESAPTPLSRQGAAPEPRLSPNGKFLTFNGSSPTDLYPSVALVPFPSLDDRWEVSEKGGAGHRWGLRGDEIYYVDMRTNTMMVVPFETQPEVRIGRPEALFSGANIPAGMVAAGSNRPKYDVSSDGQRFVVIRDLSLPKTVPVLMENWTAERDGGR